MSKTKILRKFLGLAIMCAITFTTVASATNIRANSYNTTANFQNSVFSIAQCDSSFDGRHGYVNINATIFHIDGSRDNNLCRCKIMYHYECKYCGDSYSSPTSSVNAYDYSTHTTFSDTCLNYSVGGVPIKCGKSAIVTSW